MEIIKIFVKFGLVGASGVLVNMLIYTGLITLNVNYLVAATVAFLFAVSSNFYLNFIWTFKGKGKGKSVKKKYLHFFIISLLNFIINLSILKVAVEFLSVNELTYDILDGKWTDAGTFESLAYANSIMLEVNNELSL